MKKLAIISMICLLLIIFTGCDVTTELNQRTIVQAIGIDYDELTQRYNVVLQYYSPTASSGEGATRISGDNVKISVSEADTIIDAISDGATKNGKENFYGHCEFVIIGKSLAEKGIKHVTSFLDGDFMIRSNIKLLIAETTAEQVLKTKINENIMPVQAIDTILSETQTKTQRKNINYYKIASVLNNKSGDVAIPIISIEQDDGKSSFLADKMAIFKDQNMVAVLDRAEALGGYFLRNETGNTVLSLSEGGSEKAVEIFYSDCVIGYKDGAFTAEISCKAFVRQIYPENIATADIEKEMQRGAEAKITEYCVGAYSKAVKQNGSDIFNLKKTLLVKNNAEFVQNEADIENFLKNADFKINVTVNIDRSGVLKTQ